MMTQLKWPVCLYYLLLTILILLDVTRNINQINIQSRHKKILQTQLVLALEQVKHPAFSRLTSFVRFDNETEAASRVLLLARLSRLEVSSIKAELNHAENRNEFMFHLTASGELTEIYNFVALMAENQLIFNVDHFSLVKTSRNDAIEMDLSVCKFYFSADKNNAVLSTQTWQDPFSEVITNRSDHDNMLHSISVKQLQFSGYLQQAKGIVGIVMLPNGASFLVSLGDKIGTENAVVTTISAQGVRVSNNNEEKWIENKNIRNDVR